MIPLWAPRAQRLLCWGEQDVNLDHQVSTPLSPVALVGVCTTDQSTVGMSFELQGMQGGPASSDTAGSKWEWPKLFSTGFRFLVRWLVCGVYRVVLWGFLGKWWRSLCGDGCQGSILNTALLWGWRGLSAEAWKGRFVVLISGLAASLAHVADGELTS